MSAETWKKNKTGRCPVAARGKRVIVKLRNGNICGREPASAAQPIIGWASDTTYWGDRGHPFDVVAYAIVE